MSSSGPLVEQRAAFVLAESGEGLTRINPASSHEPQRTRSKPKVFGPVRSVSELCAHYGKKIVTKNMMDAG